MKNKLFDASFILAVVYTIGHIIIAILCNTMITGAEFNLAALDALIEPCINGIWFYVLHKFYRFYFESKEKILI